MDRITVDDCLDKSDSRFELVLFASKKAHSIISRDQQKQEVEKKNHKPTVVALREIAEEKIELKNLKNKKAVEML